MNQARWVVQQTLLVRAGRLITPGLVKSEGKHDHIVNLPQ